MYHSILRRREIGGRRDAAGGGEGYHIGGAGPRRRVELRQYLYLLTWVQDANLAMTMGYDADGMMTWDGAQAWIAYMNSLNMFGYNDWRLPTALNQDGSGPDLGYVTGSEMGHLHYTEHKYPPERV